MNSKLITPVLFSVFSLATPPLLAQTISPAPEPEISGLSSVVEENTTPTAPASGGSSQLSDSAAPLPELPKLSESEEIGPFHSSFEIYEKAREMDNDIERDAQLKLAASKIAQFLKLYPQHDDALKAKYRRGTALNLTGDIKTANNLFFEIVHENKSNQYVGTAAFRLGINHFNDQQWNLALEYFDIAWRQSVKENVSHQALRYKIQCLTKLSRPKETIAALQALINDPNTDDTLRKTAKASRKKLISGNGSSTN